MGLWRAREAKSSDFFPGLEMNTDTPSRFSRVQSPQSKAATRNSRASVDAGINLFYWVLAIWPLWAPWVFTHPVFGSLLYWMSRLFLGAAEAIIDLSCFLLALVVGLVGPLPLLFPIFRDRRPPPPDPRDFPRNF